MGSQNWGSQNPKQSLTSLFWEGPMILRANKNSEDSKKKLQLFGFASQTCPGFITVWYKYYWNTISSLVFFFQPTSKPNFPPPKKLVVGPRRRGIAMWEIPRCKKWPGPREVSSLLGTTNHVTPRFFVVLCFFCWVIILGAFWIYGDFWVIFLFFFGVIFVFNQGCENLNGWLVFSGDFVLVRNVRMAFACDASGVQQKMPTGLVPRPRRCGSCDVFVKVEDGKAAAKSKVGSAHFPCTVANLWRRTTWISRRWNCGSNLMCITTSHCLRVSQGLEKIHLFPLAKRWGLAWMSQRLMKRNPFHIHRGHGFLREIIESQGSRSSAIWYDCHSTRVLWSSAGLVCFVKVDGSIALKERHHKLVWRWFEWVQTGEFLRRFDGQFWVFGGITLKTFPPWIQLGVWSEFKGLDSSFFRWYPDIPQLVEQCKKPWLFRVYGGLYCQVIQGL